MQIMVLHVANDTFQIHGKYSPVLVPGWCPGVSLVTFDLLVGDNGSQTWLHVGIIWRAAWHTNVWVSPPPILMSYVLAVAWTLGFLKAPWVILMCSQDWEPLPRSLLHPRPFKVKFICFLYGIALSSLGKRFITVPTELWTYYSSIAHFIKFHSPTSVHFPMCLVFTTMQIIAITADVYMGLLMQPALREVPYHTYTNSFSPQVWPGSLTGTPVLYFQVSARYIHLNSCPLQLSM